MATLIYTVAESGHFKVKKMEFWLLKKCNEMNKSFHNAVCYIFYTKLSACANDVHRLNSDSTYLINLKNWFQSVQLFCFSTELSNCSVEQ